MYSCQQIRGQIYSKIYLLFVNTTKIYQLKTKDSEIKKNYPLCIGNTSGNFPVNKMKKKKKKTATGLNGCVYKFSADFRSFNTSNVIGINKYIIKKHDLK